MFILGIISTCLLGLFVMGLVVMGALTLVESTERKEQIKIILFFSLLVGLAILPIIYVALTFSRLC